jgi:hypothetical protein
MDKDYDIEIEDAEKIRREIKNNETGKVNIFYTQKAWLNVGRRNDVEFNIPLSESARAFPVGRYRFTRRNGLFSVNEYGNLQVSREITYASIDFPIVPIIMQVQSEKKAA